mgnify:FL=1
MFQYSRLDVMFNRIRINEYTSVNDLESLLGITDRTIRNDIQEINNDLEKNGAIIKLKRNHGYYISIFGWRQVQQICKGNGYRRG